MRNRIIAGAVFGGVALVGFHSIAVAQDIPAAMRGTWVEQATFCTTPTSDGRIAVSARGVDFFASSCRVNRLRPIARNAVRLAVTCEESGEKENATIDLRLISNGRLSLKRGTGLAETLVRCPGDPPVR